MVEGLGSLIANGNRTTSSKLGCYHGITKAFTQDYSAGGLELTVTGQEVCKSAAILEKLLLVGFDPYYRICASQASM